MQTRVGGLLAVTGFILAFTLSAGWAVAVGAVLLVAGGLVLAVAAESMLDQTTSADEVTEASEPPAGMAA
ncbi:MAG: hypothetical protein ACRDY4_11600 [Acidimicrobiia bacterium]